MDNWYNTVGGRQFADRTVPRTANAIEALVEEIYRLDNRIADLIEVLTIISSKLSEQTDNK